MQHHDLLICLRCHEYANLVIDTIDSVRKFTDPDTTKLMVSVDGNNIKLAKVLRNVLPDAVFVSQVKWGWGPGLFGLLAESAVWAENQFSFSHFMSIDYDTLFIAEGADHDALALIDSQDIGLIGNYESKSKRWGLQFEADRPNIIKMIGKIPDTYKPGEGVQGGCFVVTRTFLNKMHTFGMFKPPYSHARLFTSLADDHLIVLYMRMCGLQPKKAGDEFRINWDLVGDPFTLLKEGVKVFHTTKIRADARDKGPEYQVRNYYRQLRGKGPLKT